MADCTVAEVLTQAKVFIGDGSSEITSELISFYQLVYGELVNLLLKTANQQSVREAYFVLPANTNVVFPAQLGVTDMLIPQQVWERGGVESVSISSVVDGTPVTVNTSSAFSTGSDGLLQINGIVGTSVPPWLNRAWFVTALSSTSFTLNGSYKISTGFGTITPSAGQSWTAQWSAEQWQPMRIMDYRPQTNIAPQQVLGSWFWEENALFVPGASEARQLWIEYLINTSPPASGTIGLLAGSELQFLAMGTAARFETSARQMPAGPSHTLIAYGPSGEADGTGGLLRQLILPLLKQRQQLPRRSGLVRPRRNVLVGIYSR